MILLSTLWQTVRWRHVLFWYTSISLFFWISYASSEVSMIMAIMGQMGMTLIAITVILGVWNKVITDCHEGYPILWIFSTVVKDIRIFEKTEGDRLAEMIYWCRKNCNGKWKHCQHGYFVFRKKTDAMAFKLRWS